MRKRLGATLALLLCSTPAMAPAEIVWGVNGHPITAYPGIPFEEQLDLVKGMNATSYRVNISNLEQAADLERLIEIARVRGLTILPVLTPGDVDMDNDSTDDLYRKAHAFAVGLATRFGDDLPVWELGNELENYAILKPCEQKDDGTSYPCDFGPAGGVDRLDYYGPRWAKVSAVLRGLTEGIASVDPSLRKAVGTAGWGHLGAFDRMADDGIQWDISVWHSFGEDPEWAFQHLRTFGHPIWLTEFNHPYGSRDGDEAMAEGLHQMISRLIDLEDRYDVEGAHVYELLDEPYFAPSPEATMGLVPLAAADGGWKTMPPRPAYAVVRDLIASYAQRCDLGAAEAMTPLAEAQVAYGHCLVVGTEAPPSELSTWAGAIAGGQATVREMLESLVRSPAFRERYTMDDAEFISRIYRTLLRRDPDGDGWRDYSQQLAAGTLTRQNLAIATIYSGEFAERHPLLFRAAPAAPVQAGILPRDCDLASLSATGVEQQARYAYCLLLGREPDAAEIATAAAESIGDLVPALIESPEFAARYQVASLSDPDYVDLAYRLLLDRDADGGGRDAFVASLGDGSLTREMLTLALVRSAEFDQKHPAFAGLVGTPAPAAPPAPPRLRPRDCDLGAAAAIATQAERQVAYAHCLVIGTPARPEDLRRWASEIAHGKLTIGAVVDGLIESADFNNRYALDSLSQTDFVVVAYEMLLGRQPDNLGLDSYARQLEDGALSRRELLHALMWSSEFAQLHRVLVQ
jgi:hypothetical protein